MVSMLQSGRVKPETITLVFAASLVSKSNEFKIRIMCSSGATRLPADCQCFSELALYKNSTKCVGLVQNRHHLIIM